MNNIRLSKQMLKLLHALQKIYHKNRNKLKVKSEPSRWSWSHRTKILVVYIIYTKSTRRISQNPLNVHHILPVAGNETEEVVHYFPKFQTKTMA